jgi:hypothetical protein
MDLLLSWLLRGIVIAIGIGAAAWIVFWVRHVWRSSPERWTARLAGGMIVLVFVYAAAHIRLLAQRATIEDGRERYAIYGDPRRTEQRRGEVRGWILDCSGQDDSALAYYHENDGAIEREYPLGEGGANFLGGGRGADERDYTVEVLFSPHLREARSILDLERLHAVGKDLRLTLCRDVTGTAYRQLAQAGRPGAVVVQEVETGAVVAYAATGAPGDPPLGLKRYSPPGSVFKLALAAVWYEHGMPENIRIACPAEIRVSSRATIANYGREGRADVIGPTGMLIPSCNTAAVWMALHMREQIGSEPFVEAYRRFGFTPYEETAPTDSIADFWLTDSEAWATRMSPAPSRIQISPQTGDDEWAQLAIGQGPIDVTVLGVSRFIQGIANDGVMRQPRFEFDLVDDGRGERIMSEATALRLQRDMLAVVESGTGRSAGEIVAGTGWSIGGKTGTAQVAGRPDNGWFAAILFSPDGEPRYTIVSFLEGGGPGGGAPAAIAGQVARELTELEFDFREGS